MIYSLQHRLIEPIILTTARHYLFAKIGNDPLLRNGDFRRFWLSSTLNGFGAQISGLAVPLCAVLLMHATPAQMGMMIALQAVPFALFSLPAGVLLERHRKLPIILSGETASGLALASVALASWCGWLSMGWLYCTAFLIGTVSVLGGGAEQIFLTQLIGREALVDAQTKFVVTDSASRLIGPGIAGMLVQWLTAPLAILVTACGFMLSVLNLRQIGLTEARPPPSEQHPLRDIRDGLVFVWGHPLLRALAWGAGFWHIMFYGYAALSLLFATRVLGLTPGVIGVAQTLGGLGVFSSSVLLKPLVRRFGPGSTILIGMGATALGFAAATAIPVKLFGSAQASAVAYAVVNFFCDCGVMLFFMPYMSLRQKVTPDAFLGRMISTMRFLTVATAPLAAILAGALAGQIGIRPALACIAGGGVLLTICMAWLSPLRSVRS
jgi:MFS family permease